MISFDSFNNFIGQGENPGQASELLQLDSEFDRYFGLNYDKVENKLKEGEFSLYKEQGLLSSALNTSYLDFYQLSQFIPDGATLVDLGSGYGRASLVFNELEKNVKVISVEKVAGRLKESKRVHKKKKFKNYELIQGDFLDENFNMPIADFYFIYLPTGDLLEKIFSKLQKIATHQRINLIAIESHGDLIDRLKNEGWLDCSISGLKTSLPRHDNNIYHFVSKQESIVQYYQAAKEYYLNLISNTESSLCNIGLNEVIALIQSDKLENLNWVVKSFCPTSGDVIKEIPAKDSELFFYEGEATVETKSPRRLLKLKGDDRILGLAQSGCKQRTS